MCVGDNAMPECLKIGVARRHSVLLATGNRGRATLYLLVENE